MNIEINVNQKWLIFMALERLRESIWDDPEVYGLEESDYLTQDEFEKAIQNYIDENINVLLKQF